MSRSLQNLLARWPRAKTDRERAAIVKRARDEARSESYASFQAWSTALVGWRKFARSEASR